MKAITKLVCLCVCLVSVYVRMSECVEGDQELLVFWVHIASKSSTICVEGIFDDRHWSF